MRGLFLFAHSSYAFGKDSFGFHVAPACAVVSGMDTVISGAGQCDQLHQLILAQSLFCRAPEKLSEYDRNELVKWGKVVKEANICLE